MTRLEERFLETAISFFSRREHTTVKIWNDWDDEKMDAYEKENDLRLIDAKEVKGRIVMIYKKK